VYIAYRGDEVLSDIVAYQPKILRANPSYLRLVAEQIRDQETKPLHPKTLISNGEVLDEQTRMYLETVFECPVFDWYGAHEATNAAWECSKHEGKHIDADTLILETIRNGEPVGPGEKGEILVTNLLSYGMPFIRYRLGDIGILDNHKCSCGRPFPLLKSVEGRIVDSFILPDGSAVTPKAVMTVIQGTPSVSRYQAVQESENKVRIELMARPSDPPVALDELAERCHKLLGDDVEIESVITDRTALKAKFRPVISKLTVADEPRWTEPRAPVT
jgi:phenylacetate-CoA ligase